MVKSIWDRLGFRRREAQPIDLPPELREASHRQANAVATLQGQQNESQHVLEDMTQLLRGAYRDRDDGPDGR